MQQEIHIEEMANGMVLVAERMSWLESAAFSLAVPAGTIRDPMDRLGLGNFVCEMVQRGSGELESRQFIEALDRLGTDRGSNCSAVHTSFSVSTLASRLGRALEIYADMVQRPHFPPAQVEDARQVCEQELQAVEDDVAQRTMMKLRRMSYPEPWGRASVGTFEGIAAIDATDIQRFFRDYYTPAGAILAVAGKFDWEPLKEHVAKAFGAWRGDRRELPPVSLVPPSNVHDIYDSTQTQIGVAYESIPFRHPDYLAARAAVGVLSDGMSSRLFTKVREERGLCYTVYAHHHSLRDAAKILCYAGTSTDRAQATLDVMLAEVQRLSDGIDEAELMRLKARTKSALIMQQESSTSRCASLVGDWFHLGRIRTTTELRQLIDQLTVEHVNEFLRQHRPSEFTVVTLGKSALEVNLGLSQRATG